MLPRMRSLQQLLVCCGRSRRRIKIITEDGLCLKYDSPLSVKEALADRENHAVFHSDSWATPLHETAELVPGQIYFLIPLQDPHPRPFHRPLLRSQSSAGSLHLCLSGSGLLIEPGRRAETASVHDRRAFRAKLLMSQKRGEDSPLLMKRGEDSPLLMKRGEDSPLLMKRERREAICGLHGGIWSH